MSINRLAMSVAAIAAGIMMTAGAAVAVEAEAKSAVNVRTGPGTTFGIIDQLSAGEVVEITECAPSNFCFVERDGPDGWVSATYLAPVDDEEVIEEGSGSNPDCSFGFNFGPGAPSLSINCGEGGAPPPPPPSPSPDPDDEPSACFYTGNNFDGDDLCIGLGTRNALNATFNNKISSVELFGGAKARLCEEPNLSGYCRNVNSDTAPLVPQINNKASSLVVFVGAPPAPEPEPEPEPDVPDTYSTGLFDLKQTFSVNLDNGTGNGQTDIFYHAVSNVEKYLEPTNGAMIALGDGSNRGYDGCSEELFSNAGVPLEDAPPGTYICVKTNQGRISQFRVNSFVGTTMKIGYTTWSN